MDVRRPERYAAILALVLFVGGLAMSPPVTAHPDHLQIENNVVGSNTDLVNETNWLGQSIVPTSSFYVSKVALLVSDTAPTDNLTVSIRTDAVGSPSTTVISQGTADGPSTFTWVEFPLSPYVELQALGTYWIVVRSTAAGGGGYEWMRSPNNLAYPAGTGVKSSDGISWSPQGRDYPFRVYGFVQPSLSFSVSLSDPVIRTAENAVFAVNFTNSGQGSSEALWVNISLPAPLLYVADDAASIGGARTGTSFRFADVAPGSYSFNVSVTPTGGTADGTVATSTVTFDALDHVGVPLVRSQLDLTATIHNARLIVSLQTDPAGDPGETIAVNATVRNTGRAAASDILLEASIDSNATFVYAPPPATYDNATRSVLRAIPSLLPDESLAMNWTIRLNVKTVDGSWILSEGIVTYADPSGTLVRERTSVLARVQAPQFAPVLMLNRQAVEAAEEVAATLYYNNTGSVSAPEARATWSLGGHYKLVALLPPVPFVETADGFIAELANIPPGNFQLVARLEVLRSLDNGLPLPLQVTWNATDGNMNPFDPLVVETLGTLNAPNILASVAAPERVSAGSVFVLTATIRNLGDAPGIAWVNLTIPETVSLVGDNGTVEPILAGRLASWRFPSIPERSHVVFGISLVAIPNSVVESFRLSVAYTDSAGSPPRTVVSNAVAIEVLAPPPEGFPSWVAWITLLAAGSGVAAVVVRWKRRGPAALVDEVFVADRSGVLLAHRTAGAVARRDEDVLIAMFKIVQDFARDAFSEGKDEAMSALAFGERKILIERGNHHFISVIYRGVDRGDELLSRVKYVSREIDGKFGPILEKWSGELETVRGIALLLPLIWRRRRFPIGDRGPVKSRGEPGGRPSSPSPPTSGSR